MTRNDRGESRGDRSAVYRRRRLAISRGRAQGSDRARRSSVTRCRLASASRPHQSGDAGIHQRMGELGRRHSAPGSFWFSGRRLARSVKGRAHVTVEDIRTLAYPALRHRILLNYRAEAEGVNVETVIKKLIETVKAPL